MEEKYITIRQIDFDKLLIYLEESNRKIIDAVIEHFSSQEKNIKYIHKEDVARIYNVNVRTVKNWVKNGEIKEYSLGGLVLYKEDEILSAPKYLNKYISRH